MSKHKQNNEFQFGRVLLISLAHHLHDIYSSFFVPLLPLLKEKLALTNSTIGILMVIQRLPSLLNPFVGIIADSFPVRFFIIIAPAITSITMSLIGIAPGITILAILLFVTGFSSTIFHTPAPVMIKKLSGNKTGKGMSFYMLGGELARTLGPLIITGAVSLWGLEGTWRLMPFGLVASFVLFLRIRKIPISQDIKKKGNYKDILTTFKALLPFFLILSGFIFFRGIAKSALTTFLTIYLTDNGESLWFVNTVLSILQFAGAVGVLMSGIISDKIGTIKMLFILAVMIPILMGLFLIAEGFWFIPVIVLLGIFIFSTGPVMLSLVNKINTNYPAFINGVFMTVSFVMSSITTLITGFAGDIIGLEKTFEYAAYLSAGSIPFVFLFKKWVK